jgi:CheY-like chemotaxis protein
MAEARLLSVDDSEEFRLGLTNMLRYAGYAVQAGADGQQALRVLEHGTFDLVLTDLEVPVMDGRALV